MGVGEERLLRCCCWYGGVVFVVGWCFEGDVRVGVAKPVVVDVEGGVDSVLNVLELMTVYQRRKERNVAPLSVNGRSFLGW